MHLNVYTVPCYISIILCIINFILLVIYFVEDFNKSRSTCKDTNHAHEAGIEIGKYPHKYSPL